MNQHSDPTSSMQRSYWCFISYKHTDNKAEGRQWASWLHQQLETYEIPEDLVGNKNQGGDEIPSRIFPVFRDEEELGAGSDLSDRIYRALDNTKVLVVLCSPRVVESTYVFEEIRHFKRIGKADFVYAAVIDGEPGSRVIESGKCFPDTLQFDVDQQGDLLEDQPAEPLAADFRLPDGTQGWTSPEAYRLALSDSDARLSRKQIDQKVANYSKRLDLAKLKLISGILRVPLGVLQKRDKAYQLELARKSRRLRRWLTAVTLLTVLAIAAGIIAMIQRDQTQQALSNNLFDQGQDLMRRDRHGEGLASLAASLETRKQNRPAADAIFLQLARGNALLPVRKLPPPPPGTRAFLPQDLKALENFQYNDKRLYPLAQFSDNADGVDFYLPIRKDEISPFEFSHIESYTCQFGGNASWTKIGNANSPPWDGYSLGEGRLVSVPEGESGPDYGFLHLQFPKPPPVLLAINTGGGPETVGAMGLAAISPDQKRIGLHGHLLNYRGDLDWDLPTEPATLRLIDAKSGKLMSKLDRDRFPKNSPDLTDNETLTAVRFVGPYFISHFSNFERRGWRTEIVDCTNPNNPTLISDTQLLPGLIDDYNESTKEFLVRTREGLITYRLASMNRIDYQDNIKAIPEITGAQAEAGVDVDTDLEVRSSDGKWLADATRAGSVTIYRSQDSSSLRTFSLQIDPTVEGGYFIERMLFLPNSPYLLVSLGVQSDFSFAWSIWDFNRGKEIFTSSSEVIMGTDRLIGTSSDGKQLIFEDVQFTSPRRGKLFLYEADSSASPLLANLAELAAGIEQVEGSVVPIDIDGLFQRREKLLTKPETQSPGLENWLQNIAETMAEPSENLIAAPSEKAKPNVPPSENPQPQPEVILKPEQVEPEAIVPTFPSAPISP